LNRDVIGYAKDALVIMVGREGIIIVVDKATTRGHCPI
jgi:hypothetical protein